MKTTTSSSYHHKNLKDALINKALDMVEKDGLSSLTLRALTNSLGASRSAIYRHYSSKDALLQAVIREGFDKLDAHMQPILESDLTISDKLYKMGKEYINFAISNPNLYRMVFGHELQKQREESCDINKEEDAPGFHKLVALVEEAQENSLLKEQDPFLQATVIWSMMHGLSNLLIDGHIHIQDNIKALYDISFETLINGMSTYHTE